MRLRIEPSGLELQLGPGERVIDALDSAAGPPPVPLGCRAANCARCLVRVRHGEALLQPADPREREVLEMIQADPSQRLGCQISIRDDCDPTAIGTPVVLRVVGPG